MSSFLGCWDKFICLIATSIPVDVSIAVYTVPDALKFERRAYVYLLKLLQVLKTKQWHYSLVASRITKVKILNVIELYPHP